MLIEREENGLYYGRTEADAPEVDNEIAVHSGLPLMSGAFVNVLVRDADEFDLVGDVIE